MVSTEDSSALEMTDVGLPLRTVSAPHHCTASLFVSHFWNKKLGAPQRDSADLSPLPLKIHHFLNATEGFDDIQ